MHSSPQLLLVVSVLSEILTYQVSRVLCCYSVFFHFDFCTKYLLYVVVTLKSFIAVPVTCYFAVTCWHETHFVVGTVRCV